MLTLADRATRDYQTILRATERGVPIVAAWRERKTVLVWCEHERIWHRHSPGDGPRCAHCLCPSSPYQISDYFLVEVGQMTADIRRWHGREYRGFRRCACGAERS